MDQDNITRTKIDSDSIIILVNNNNINRIEIIIRATIDKDRGRLHKMIDSMGIHEILIRLRYYQH